jgi:hypothetical protein
VAQLTDLLIDYDGLSGLSFGWAPTDYVIPSFFPYRGWLDEVRFSNRVLTPAEFLQMVPEPSSGLLALLGLAAFTLYVRLRKKVTL